MAEPELSEAEIRQMMRAAMARYEMVRSQWQRYLHPPGFWSRPRARALRELWRRLRSEYRRRAPA